MQIPTSHAKQGASSLTYLHMYVYISNCCHYKGIDLSVTDVFPHPIDAVTEQRLSALRLQAMKDYSEDALPRKKKTMYYTIRALVA